MGIKRNVEPELDLGDLEEILQVEPEGMPIPEPFFIPEEEELGTREPEHVESPGVETPA